VHKKITIVPAESALRLESRSLGDAGLRAFMEENVSHLVTLAAQHFGPWNALDCGFVFQSNTLQRDIIGKEAKIKLLRNIQI
jgi:hypothetical protein